MEKQIEELKNKRMMQKNFLQRINFDLYLETLKHRQLTPFCYNEKLAVHHCLCLISRVIKQ